MQVPSYNPQKPNQSRVVFDSSARYSGVSLNDVLLTGPDLINSLVVVLQHFWKEKVAILADIQQMFHCFLVYDGHRNFLRFLWHKDNDTNKEVIGYQRKVHVFGNRPSPAMAIYGLQRAIREGAQEHLMRHKELCIFSNASTKAIGAVAYLKVLQKDGQFEVAFVMGKAKLAHLSEPTIPRLELCAAVLAVEMAAH